MTPPGTVIRKSVLALALGFAFAATPWTAIVGGGSNDALAQYSNNKSKGDQRSKKKTRRVPTLSEKVYKRLTEAQELMELEQYAEVEKVLQEAANIRRLKTYDRAMIHQMLGYSFANQEKYRKAIVEFEQLLSVGSDTVPEGVVTSTLYNLAQMYMVLEEWRNGLQTLGRWFAVAQNPGPDPYILVAQGHLQLEEYREAISPALTAIKLDQAKGKKAKENWYQLVLASYFELEDYAKVADILAILVDIYPKKVYWLQLAAVYGELKEEKKQLGIMEVSYEQGYLNRSREIVNLSQLFLYHEVPFKAAEMLEKELKNKNVDPDKENWELLANAFINAAEIDRAIPYLTRAAGMADDGELYIRLGQAYMEKEAWDDASKAFDNAIEKGDLRQPGTAYLLLGMSSFHGNNFTSARQAFRASGKVKRLAKTSRQWLRFLEREQRRRAQK